METLIIKPIVNSVLLIIYYWIALYFLNQTFIMNYHGNHLYLITNINFLSRCMFGQYCIFFTGIIVWFQRESVLSLYEGELKNINFLKSY